MAANTEIEQIDQADSGTLSVAGTFEDTAGAGNIYIAVYDQSGKMISIKKAVISGGSFSADGLAAAGDMGAVSAFLLDGTEGAGYKPEAEKTTVAAVSTKAGLDAALLNGECQAVFITDDINLTYVQNENNKLELSKNVMIANGASLTVGSDYAFHVCPGAALTIYGTLNVDSGATVNVHGSNYNVSGEDKIYTSEGAISMRGGNIYNSGEIVLLPAHANSNDGYSNGNGGWLGGDAGSITIDSTGLIRVDGGGPDTFTVDGNEISVYNNGGTIDVDGFTVTGSGAIENGNMFIVRGGSQIMGTLNIRNYADLNLMTDYDDDGSSNITVNTPTFAGSVILNNEGNIYEAASVTTEAGLRAALAGEKDIEIDRAFTLTGAATVPQGMTLRTHGEFTLASSGSLTVNGRFEQYGYMKIEAGGAMTAGTAGSIYVYADLDNYGTVTADGMLFIGGDGRTVTFRNLGSDTLIIGDNGTAFVELGATLYNSGTVNGTVTVGSYGSGGAGTVNGSGVSTRTGRTVSTFDELKAALDDGTCAWIGVTDGIEITENLDISKPLAVSADAWLRINGDISLTVSAETKVFGWVEINGELKMQANLKIFGWVNIFGRLTAEEGYTLYDLGSLYLSDSGTIAVNGTVNIGAGKLMKTYGTVAFGEIGVISVGGTLAWGNDNMPTLGSGGYSGDGRIVSTSQTALSAEAFMALVSDDSCDNIEVRFNLTLQSDVSETLPKSVSICGGYSACIPSGTTITVEDGRWLNVQGGGTLENNGTIIVEGGENSGHFVLDSGATLLNNGTISVYGDMQIQDENNSTITGKESITFYHFLIKQDLALRLEGLLADYGLAPGSSTGYSTANYKDWDEMSGEYKTAAAFVLNNLTTASLWGVTEDTDTYLRPFNWMKYGLVIDTLEELWHAIKKDSTDLPASVAIAGLLDGDNVSVHDYGGGSAFDILMGKFMAAVGPITVGDNQTYTVSRGDDYEAQTISYKRFTGQVTVTSASSGGADTIEFVGCTFDNPVAITADGTRMRVVFNGCSLQGHTAAGAFDVAVAAKLGDDDKPTFNLFDNGNIVNLQFTGGTTGVTVNSDCCVYAESYVSGGTFTLCGVVYTGAESVGSSGFSGKYQLDSDGNDGTSVSYHAGGYVRSVSADTATIYNFNLWSNAKNDVALNLGGSSDSCRYVSGGAVSIRDENADDVYSISLAGYVGDAAPVTGSEDATRLTINLGGKVDISGLAVYNTEFYAEQGSSVMLTSGGDWVTPVAVGDYNSAAVELGKGDMVGYSFALYSWEWSNSDNTDEWVQITGATLNTENEKAYLEGIKNPGNLKLEVTASGKKVTFEKPNWRFDEATNLDLAIEIYRQFVTDTEHFTAPEATADPARSMEFVTDNGIMPAFSNNPDEPDVIHWSDSATMETIVNAFWAIKLKVKGDTALPVFYTADRVSGNLDAGFADEVLALAASSALGTRGIPYSVDEDGETVWEVGYGSDVTVGKTLVDDKNNSDLRHIVTALKTALAGNFYIGDSPYVYHAAFVVDTAFSTGTATWTDVTFNNCTFAAGIKLTFITASGGNINFDNCTFNGGLSIEVDTVGNAVITDAFRLNGIPSGAVVTSQYACVELNVWESAAVYTLNGVTVTARDFVTAGLSDDQKWVNIRYELSQQEDDSGNIYYLPNFAAGGAVAELDVTDSAPGFNVINVNNTPDTNAVTVDFDPGWTGDFDNELFITGRDGGAVKLEGTITGGTGDTNLNVELCGTVDASAVTLAGNCTLFIGRWQDIEHDIIAGAQKLNVYYDSENYSENYANISIHSADPADIHSGGAVIFYNYGAEDKVTVNGISGVSLGTDGQIVLGGLAGNLYDSESNPGGYQLTLYEYAEDAWSEITETTISDGKIFLSTGDPLPTYILLRVNDRGEGTAYSYAWFIDDGDGGVVRVTSYDELEAALGDDSIYEIHLDADITLETSIDFNKDVYITEYETLTVPSGVSLSVSGGLGVQGCLVNNGEMYVFGWLDCDDWDSRITGGARIYVYAHVREFAINLYNTYALDYGLATPGESDDYSGRYASDYLSSGDADGRTAVDFLIKNGAVTLTEGINPYVVLQYGTAMEILGGLADALEAKLGRAISGYGLWDGETEYIADTFLCTSGENPDYGLLLQSFNEAVAQAVVSEKVLSVTRLSVTDGVTYTQGLDNWLQNMFKTYSGAVTVTCPDGEYAEFYFIGCTFNGSVTVNGGSDAGSNVYFIGCTFNGDLTVLDNDGGTNIIFKDYESAGGGFLETTINTTEGEESTVTVTEATTEGATNGARLNTSCNSVVLNNLPTGMAVINSDVSVGVVGAKPDDTFTINGTVFTAGDAEAGKEDSFFYAAFTYWQEVVENVEIPCVGVAGSIVSVDATQNAGTDIDPFLKYKMYEDSENGLYTVDALFIPKAGIGTALENASGRFWVDFIADGNGGYTAEHAPYSSIKNEDGQPGMYIWLDPDGAYDYELNDETIKPNVLTGVTKVPDDTNPFGSSLLINYTVDETVTSVVISPLPCKIKMTKASFAKALYDEFSQAKYGLDITPNGDYDYSANYPTWTAAFGDDVQLLAFLVENGIVSADLNPGSFLTRGEMAQWCYNLLGKSSAIPLPSSLPTGNPCTFTDVSNVVSSEYYTPYYDAITALAAAGMVKGDSGYFYPNNAVPAGYESNIVLSFVNAIYPPES